MELHILHAAPEDLETILALQKECYKTEGELHCDLTIPPLTQTIESIREDYRSGTLFLKGVVNGELIASVRGNSTNNTVHIGRLVVKEGYQNKGIGQQMMTKMEQSFPDCKRCELFTGNKSKKNLGLYSKLGYSEFKRQYVHDQLTLVFLEKTLD